MKQINEKSDNKLTYTPHMSKNANISVREIGTYPLQTGKGT